MDKFKSLINRRIIQILTLIGTNSYFRGFIDKTICKSNTKMVCVPFMNCYSCPGARFSCPIGSLQAVLGKRKKYFSFYIFGTLIMLGILFGRLICGFLCPFGFLQDMIYKIPSKKYKLHKIFKYVKYPILLVTVIILPMFFTNDVGTGAPYFCKYICPVGTLEGGIFLVLINKSLQSIIGFLYFYKLSILIVILVLSVFMYRPFCKIFCPLAVIYGIFNKVSFYQITIDNDKCISCNECSRVCKMDINPKENQNSAECIRCGECITYCPTDALKSSFSLKNNKDKLIKKEVN
ncbi:4Fe-4S binding protein [Clostridiaceae bacterium M8S5]|nr:4Fe-4S binding protein [Clostridiaceae bacterium M8S5]